MKTTQRKINKLTLVTNGTGKTGGRIVEKMQDIGLPVRVASRSADTPFDWEDATTWGPNLQGVSAVYISFYPDLCVPGAIETIRSFVQQAVAIGVKQLVLLSGRGEEAAEASEKIVQESGVDWTILRASWFAQNFSEGFLHDFVLGGEIALPARDVPEPFIDVEDIADAAVAALTDSKHNGQLYDLTGPRLLTFADAVDEIAKASGRNIQYTSISDSDFISDMTEHGVPKEFVGMLTYLFDEVLDGRNASVTDGVLKATGRPARDFREYAAATAASGTWNQ